MWNPFAQLASTAAQIVTDGWIAMCLAVWNGGLWLMKLVLYVMDQLLTPDLSADGPGHQLYGWMFWVAGVLAVIIGMVQIGGAALRHDARALGRACLGLVQFTIAVAGWVGYAVALVAAAGGLTHSMMDSLLGVSSWNSWQPFDSLGDGAKQVTEGAVATILAFLGLFMVLAAVAHFLVIVARDVALLVIVATGPIAAAGLLHESLRGWFWKTFRWLHVAAFTPLLVVIVTGVGVQFAGGVVAGQSTGILQVIGTAFSSVVLICVAVFSPLALMKFLAFVDPGTSSGAAMRAGWQAAGGLQGILGGSSQGADGGAASQDTDTGQSGGEANADAAASSKVSNAVQGGASRFGFAGNVLAGGLGLMTKIGTQGAAITTDVTNQVGAGHNTYQPDFQGGPRSDQSGQAADHQNQTGSDQQQQPSTDPAGGNPVTSPTTSGSGGGAGGGGAGAGGAEAGAGSGAAAGGAEAAAVLIV